ncbi:hypothetical protein QAD02_023296 [Eretmocerus hayati]|uniref:Uncharacterized protein n=1 Tax=Eretmocerus hayati TaxID=131215 RepID=A0ACC2PVL8_9HYME|nr:hypothetical protein QAD02_023296 [Eretmocerus hayati]
MACTAVKRTLIESDPMGYNTNKSTKRARNSSTKIISKSSIGRQKISNITPPKIRAIFQPSKSPSSSLTTSNPSTSNLVCFGSPQQQQSSPSDRIKSTQDQNNEFFVQDQQKLLVDNADGNEELIDNSDFCEDQSSSSALDRDVALFTLSQTRLICERAMNEQREKIREEYETILSQRLAEQYDTFIKFTHDHIIKSATSSGRLSYFS